MGWPLAVSAALMDRAPGSLRRALLALAAGHLLAMAVILFPFAALMFIAAWHEEIRIVASCLVIGLGVYLLINRRHPRFLARVPPSRLALWSFLAALAHGAGLMLVPIYLGICASGPPEAGHAAAATLMGRNLVLAAGVAVLHTGAMTLSGGALAVAVHRWFGLRFLSRSWFNLDVVWALSLMLVGAISLLVGH
jgi:hypothetical protein|nr:hypothetical protein [Meridianimarinicoccus roseus]